MSRFARVAMRFRRLMPATAPVDPKTAAKRQAAKLAARAKRYDVHAIDPRTGRVRPGRVELIGATGVVIWLPHRAESPNRGLWGGHKMTIARVKATWAKRLEAAIHATRPARQLAPPELYPTLAARVEWVPAPWRVRVTATRWVKHKGHFITDRDNLNFAFKGLVDVVVTAGFLVDDSTTAIDFTPTQAISPDGHEWTSIAIDATFRE